MSADSWRDVRGAGKWGEHWDLKKKKFVKTGGEGGFKEVLGYVVVERVMVIRDL